MNHFLQFSRWFRVATFCMLLLFSAALIFHVLVITGVIDFRYVWGGRLQNVHEMVVFEVVSIALNALFLWLVLQHARITRMVMPLWLRRVLLAFTALIFLLNTIGNVVAEEALERWLATPVTFILCSCALVLLVEKRT